MRLILYMPMEGSRGLVENQDLLWRVRQDPAGAGVASQTKVMLLLQAGYGQGALFYYAPNVNVIHCPADGRSRNPVVASPAAPPGNYAYGSYSGAGGLNGIVYAPDAALTKQSSL